MTDPQRPEDWDPGQTERFVPPADPRSTWSDPNQGTSYRTPERWFEPAAAQPAAPVAAAPRRRSGAGLGQMLFVALLSALLAAGATYGVLTASGALDREGTTSAGTTTARASTAPSAGGVTTGAASGSGSTTPQSVTIDEQSAIIAAAEKVSPAVVTITVAGADAADLLQNPGSAEGVGSGIVYDDRGWILTNKHVVQDADQVVIELQDGRDFNGQVYGLDTLTDLAILKVDPDGEDLPVAPMGDSSSLKAGQLAIAIGSPLGTFQNSVTSGIMSAFGRDIPVTDQASGEIRRIRNLIQTDAAINPGNSGGALVDSSGQVVGVNTAVAGDAQGIGFAIPINIAKPMMEQALAGDKLARPYIGINYQPIDNDLQRSEDLPIDYGAWVESGDESPAVVDGSPADDAGVRDGDIITSIEDERVDVDHRLEDILSQYKPGDTVSLELLRDGEKRTLDVTLGTRPADLN